MPPIPDLERQIGSGRKRHQHSAWQLPGGCPRGLPLVEQPLPPEVPPGLPSSLSNAAPIFVRPSKIWSPQTPKSASLRLSSFRKSPLRRSGGGAFGRSSCFSSLMSSQTGIWSYGAQVSQPIFTGGALRGNLKLAESQHQQELIAYQQAIQLAFRRCIRCFDRLSETSSSSRCARRPR